MVPELPPAASSHYHELGSQTGDEETKPSKRYRLIFPAVVLIFTGAILANAGIAGRAGDSNGLPTTAVNSTIERQELLGIYDDIFRRRCPWPSVLAECLKDINSAIARSQSSRYGMPSCSRIFEKATKRRVDEDNEKRGAGKGDALAGAPGSLLDRSTQKDSESTFNSLLGCYSELPNLRYIMGPDQQTFAHCPDHVVECSTSSVCARRFLCECVESLSIHKAAECGDRLEKAANGVAGK